MSNMGKETILYSIINSTDEAYQVIPELKDAWNMTPHRILNLGETIYLNLDNNKIVDITSLSECSFLESISIYNNVNCKYLGFHSNVEIYY